jgi:hypothetical protein
MHSVRAGGTTASVESELFFGVLLSGHVVARTLLISTMYVILKFIYNAFQLVKKHP